MSELDEIVSSELFVTGLETFEDGTITLTSLPTEIIFSLNRRMKLLFARASYGYDILYKQMLAEGRIKTPYDPGQTEVPWPIRAPDGVKAGWSP
jgi:hypothetical protein